MPFNGIQLKFAEYGLCLPGIGYLLYEENTQALWSILVPLLPSTWHEVKAQVMLMRTHHDGYKLLWLLGLTVVKIWSKLHSVPEPCWFVDNTIFTGPNASNYTISYAAFGVNCKIRSISP